MKLFITDEQYDYLAESINATPYRKRWHHERSVLKKYLDTYGQLMVSKENGKEYKALFDPFLSDNLGVNFCICIQFDSTINKLGDIIYVRALDKFSPKTIE